MPNTDLQTDNHAAAWITKEQAAERLDKSVRTVLAMAADGRVKSKTERDPERRNQKTTLFDARDVQRVKANGGTPARIGPAKSTQVRMSATQVKEASLPTSAPAPVAPLPLPPPPMRPWLTLAEAVAYSGFTKKFLLEHASEYAQASADGMLDEYNEAYESIAMRDMGRGARGGRWRFHRLSLGKGI